MPAKLLKQYLDSHKIKYVTLSHSVAYTAQEIASMVHIKGKEMAKTVIVKLDDKFAMAVLPASEMVDLGAIAHVTKAAHAALATESEFRAMFPDCETGAMPPFGNLYHLPVYVDPTLMEDDEITFNAGTHHELVRMSYSDFERLVKPIVATFSARLQGAAKG